MNHYEQFISAFLFEFKEISLEKIGTLKSISNVIDPETNSLPVEFKFDKKAVTTPELVGYIAKQISKNKMLIASDLESHLSQAKEFINIGKTYQIPNVGFIKSNNQGVYELIPLSQAVKAQKNFNKPVKKEPVKKRGSSLIQIFTLLIVLAIVGGLGYEGYQYFVKPKTQAVIEDSTNNINDTAAPATNTNKLITDSVLNKPATDSFSKINYNADDTITVHYIFETTTLLIRAQSRTLKLKSFGNDAGYDSVISGSGKLYSLYLISRTKIGDTLSVKDSLAKFLQKDIQIKIPKQ